MIGHVLTDPPDRCVKIEQQRSLSIVSDQTLDPEERRDASTTGHGPDVVQARRRIEDKVPCRELDRVSSVGVVDQQFSAVVLFRCAQEQRGKEIRANPMAGIADLPDGVVHVTAKRLTAFVSIEQRWKDSVGQGRCDEQRMMLQRRQDDVADRLGQRMRLRELQVVFDAGGLVAGRDSAATQSAASSFCLASATCSCVNTSGM
jgi:hypothetical protein